VNRALREDFLDGLQVSRNSGVVEVERGDLRAEPEHSNIAFDFFASAEVEIHQVWGGLKDLDIPCYLSLGKIQNLESRCKFEHADVTGNFGPVEIEASDLRAEPEYSNMTRDVLASQKTEGLELWTESEDSNFPCDFVAALEIEYF